MYHRDLRQGGFKACRGLAKDHRAVLSVVFFACCIFGTGWLIEEARTDDSLPPKGVMVQLGAMRASGISGQVLHAEPADKDQWKATFVFHQQGNCTSSAVGRRTILTAAHCVADRQEFHAMLSVDQLPMTCDRIADYATDHSADYALCLLDAPLPDLGEGFERVGTDDNLTKGPGRLLLQGYGCTTDQGTLDFGNLYLGFATIADRSLDSALGPNHILTRGGAALCFGDSGGGTYWVESESQVAGHRLLIGIASKGDIDEISWVSKTSSKVFLDWARGWAKLRKVSICGIVGQEDHCRTS